MVEVTELENVDSNAESSEIPATTTMTAGDDAGTVGKVAGSGSRSCQDFEYREKDMLIALKKRLQERLNGFTIVDNPTSTAHCCAVKVYGQAFERVQHKKKKSTLVDVKLEIKWYGRYVLIFRRNSEAEGADRYHI